VLYHSRDLVPRNVAEGPLSVYACTACHEDAVVDGRLHPAKMNRFRSMTKTDRGIATTPPYLSIGEITTLTEFADNIIASHAQGWEKDASYDRYPVRVRTSVATSRTLDPDETRHALAAYMAILPNEPNPFAGPVGAFSAAARRGAHVYLESGCARCHQPVGHVALGNRVSPARLIDAALRGAVAFAGPDLIDVGTPVLGKGGNNPPSLRGLWSTPPYFSDGSARTLADVLARTNTSATKVHAPANTSGLSEQERLDLAEFLRSL
jgi:cytochrome c peroxidase